METAGVKGAGQIGNDIKATLNRIAKGESGSIKLSDGNVLCAAAVLLIGGLQVGIDIYELIKIKHADDIVVLLDDGGIVSHITQKQTIPMLEERIQELNEMKNSKGC